MPFGHKSLPARVYRYGARVDIASQELIYSQLRGANSYRNKLVELELHRRSAVEAALYEIQPLLRDTDAQIAHLTNQIDELRTMLRDTRQHDHRRTAISQGDRQAIELLRSQRTILYGERKELRAKTFASLEWKVIQKVIDDKDSAERKQAYGEAQCGWGTKLTVGASMSRCRTGAPPRFKRFAGGRIAVQLQRGLAPAKAIEGVDSRLALAPHPVLKSVWIATLQLAKGQKLVVSYKQHRALPDCKIQWVYLVCRRVGTHDRWSIQFVCAKNAWPRKHGSGTVAVNVGWRAMEEGIRAATWVGDDGLNGVLYLANQNIDRLDEVKALRSIRDKNFDVAKLQLLTWLASHQHPESLTECTSTLAQWKSQARLAALVIRWRTTRFTGDEAIFLTVEAWRKQDRHLYEWESNSRRSFLDWRKWLYRQLTADLSRYHKLLIGKINWKSIQDKPVDEESDDLQYARKRKGLVSPSELEACLKHGFTEIERIDANNLTATCSNCGALSNESRPEQLFHTCTKCMVTYDQDENHCKNLLARAGVLKRAA